MTDNIHPLIAVMLAKPITHNVVTTYSNGKINTLGVRSMAQAKNHQITMSRQAGRDLVSRETGETVRVVSIEIVKVAA